MSSATNINKLWMITNSNFISLNWRTAKSLSTFYLKKIYCESLKIYVMIVSLTTQNIYKDQTVITITRLEIWR